MEPVIGTRLIRLTVINMREISKNILYQAKNIFYAFLKSGNSFL